MMARLLLIASDRILLKEGDEMALADKVAEVVAATLAGNVLGRKIRSAYAG
jgi:hypothetical protein